jgi:prephenate dehydrogenase
VDVGVVGLGLIGGSIALNLAQDFTVGGFDTNKEARTRALEIGAITYAAPNLRSLADAKIVFLATPPSGVIPTLRELGDILRPEAVVTDCSGSKTELIAAIERESPKLLNQFVGGHPMAGRESGGIENASAELFQGAAWILTPGASTDIRAIDMVVGMIPTFGAHPVIMTPEEHDEAVALVSHLPHVLAGTLVQMALGLRYPEVAGGSWRDLTRVAGADPQLWTEVVMSNRTHVARAILELNSRLEELQEAIESGNRAKITRFFEASKAAKKREVDI